MIRSITKSEKYLNYIRDGLLLLAQFVLAGCKIYGYAPFGTAFFSALFSYGIMKGKKRISICLVSIMSMWCFLDGATFTKYFMVELLYVGIMYGMSMRDKELDMLWQGIALGGLVLLFESTEILFYTNVPWERILMTVSVAFLSAGLHIVFYRGVEGVYERLGAHISRQQICGEEIVGIATIMALSLYSIYVNITLPLAIMECVIFLVVLSCGYRYGAGAGATMGCILGLVMGIQYNNASVSGMLALMGLGAGMFASLGKIGSTVAAMCIYLLAGCLYISEFLTGFPLQGILVASMMFLLVPQYGGMDINNPEVNDAVLEKCATDSMQGRLSNKLGKICESIKLMENVCLSPGESLRGLPWGQTPLTNYEQNAIIPAFFQEMASGVRMELHEAEQLIRDAKKTLASEEDMWQTAEYMDYGRLRRGLGKMGIQCLQLHMRRNSMQVHEIEMTVKNLSDKSVSTREILQKINNLMEDEYEIAENNHHLIFREYKRLVFRSVPRYEVQQGVACRPKEGHSVSGDYHLSKKVDESNYYTVLADGMGSGIDAYENSEQVAEWTLQMVETGMEEPRAAKMVNAMKTMQTGKEETASVDLLHLDLHAGLARLVKMGAGATYICRNNWVDVIRSTNLPAGMIMDVPVDEVHKKIYQGDLLVMVSDGITDVLEKNGELEHLILKHQWETPQEIADNLLEHALEHSGLRPKDDMTVVVMRLEERKSLKKSA